MDSRRRLHLAIGVIVVAILPLVSWLDGSGQLAWTMFSRTGQYRLSISADGAAINPTELAAIAAPGPTANALAGADRFIHQDVMRATMRRHLDDVARLACKRHPGARIVARLDERMRSTDSLRTSEASVQCDR